MTKYLRLTEARLKEQTTGTYKWEKIRVGVDAGNFVNLTEVKESPGRGRGLFAKRNIAQGELIMCEKAFCVVWGNESEALTAMTYDVRDDRIRVSPAGLTRAIVQKLLNNPSQVKKVYSLYGDYNGEKQGKDGKDVVDVFRVHDIVSRNAFGPGEQDGKASNNASTGLWIWAAYINHSCVANAKKEYIRDMMLLRASRPISAGEEIFHSYDESADYDARQAALLTTWGFECQCPLCSVEREDDVEVRKKRRELASEVELFVQREHWSNAKRLTIVKAKRLERALDDTYDESRYRQLPRTALEQISGWLAKATPRR